MSTMQKRQKDGKFPPQSYSETSSGSLPCHPMHYLLLIITMVCHICRGVVLGFLCVSSCSLPIRCCSLASASPTRAGGKGVSQRLKTQEVWKHNEMFKTILVVVTAQNMSVMLSRLSNNELWDVSLCFTIHISI